MSYCNCNGYSDFVSVLKNKPLKENYIPDGISDTCIQVEQDSYKLNKVFLNPNLGRTHLEAKFKNAVMSEETCTTRTNKTYRKKRMQKKEQKKPLKNNKDKDKYAMNRENTCDSCVDNGDQEL